jgi:AcrR family transcriptional regulator
MEYQQVTSTTMADTKTKTMTPRQIARRNAIVDAVRDQLEEEGYDALSMRNIASIAGVSPSTLYEIYGSKESLIIYAIGGRISDLSQEEEQYEPGLERFLHRLESIASFFMDASDSGDAIARLLFQNSGESPAKEIFMVNAVKARKTSLEEMLARKQIAADTDIDFYARTLISVTWGTVLFKMKDMLALEDLRNELVRASMAVILPIATRKSKARIQEIIDSSST